MGQGLDTVETAARDRGLSFDGVAPLRLSVVAALFAYQSLEVSTSYGRWANSPVWILPALLVPSLFAIAGFLMARSLEANADIRDFARRRLLRGWPVLVACVVVTALLIGPVATGLAMADYFADRELALYFLNLVAVPIDRLPGVFTTNPVGTINDILTFAPFAVAGMTILAVSVLRPGWAIAVPMAAIAILAGAVLTLQFAGAALPGSLVTIASGLTGRGVTALLCLLLGALAWRLRRRLVLHWAIAAAAAVILLAVAFLGRRDWVDLGSFDVLAAWPLTYLMVTLVLAPLPFAVPAAVVQKYLAGFMLFAYPVQQLTVASRLVGDSFFVNLAAAFPVTALLAIASWHGVQRRFVVQSGGLSDAYPAVARPISLLVLWQRSGELAPKFALWAAFFLVAAATMAMAMVAFTPESGGI